MMAHDIVSATRRIYSDEQELAEMKQTKDKPPVENAYQRQKREWMEAAK